MIAAVAGDQSPFLVILLMSTITLAAPLILAAMAGYTSERGGVINIALEGKMLIATIFTVLGGERFNNGFAGLLCGVAAAVTFSLLHWVLTQQYRLDHIVSGMAINALGLGGANYLDRRYINPDDTTATPMLSPWMYYAIAFILPLVLALYAKRTRGGLRLQAVGSDPDKARLMGVFPEEVRLFGLLASGLFCGLAGVLLATTARGYTDNMTDGRGFIALAALIIGGWRPIPAMIACLVFGMVQGLQIQLQGTNFLGGNIPREVWVSLPYIVTILALAGFLGKTRAPAGLGKA